MVKQVKAFQSSDGAFHANKVDALDVEYFIEVRGLIQRLTAENGIRQFSTTDMARMIKNNSKQFIEILRKNNEGIRRACAPLQGATVKTKSI